MRTHDREIRLLQISDAINVLEFYVIKTDQGAPRINCRVWATIEQMSYADADAFIADFNKATEAVRNKWAMKYRDEAANGVLHGRDVTDK